MRNFNDVLGVDDLTDELESYLTDITSYKMSDDLELSIDDGEIDDIYGVMDVYDGELDQGVLD